MHKVQIDELKILTSPFIRWRVSYSFLMRLLGQLILDVHLKTVKDPQIFLFQPRDPPDLLRYEGPKKLLCIG